jgi:predicted RNA-binding protein with PUA-like domain
MAYWLLKTEPSTYSFEDLVRDKRTRWDGIANPVALKYLRTAEKGDTALIYHTGGEKAVVGLAEILGPAYADPDNPKLAIVDIAAGARLVSPVTLTALKSERLFAESPLVRQGRLSFVPISDSQFRRIMALSKP